MAIRIRKPLWASAGLAIFSLIATPANARNYITQNAQIDWLGRGMDTAIGQPKDKCVTGDWIQSGNRSSMLYYNGEMHATDRMKQVSGSLSAGVDLFLFGGSVSTSMFTQMSTNDTTSSAVVTLSYDAKDFSLENRSLTPLGLSMVGQSPATIRENCGNEFIHHVKLGSDLYVAAKLHFRSKEEYELYKTKVKIKVLFWSKTKTITKEFYDYTENAVYSLKVLSPNGMTTKLQHLLDTQPTYCRTSEIGSCIDTSNAVFAYLFGGEYSSDVQDENLKVLSVLTQNYADSGHFQLDASTSGYMDPGYLQQQQRLDLKLTEAVEFDESMAAFATVSQTEQEKQGYLDKQLLAQENQTYLQQAYDYCQAEPGYSACKSKVDNTLLGLNPLRY